MDITRIWLVAKREWSARMAQRSFRIVTIVQVVAILIGACVPTIIARFQDDSQSETRIAIIDDANINALQRLTPYFQGVSDDENVDTIVLSSASGSLDEERASVNDGDIDALMTTSRDASGALAFTYETKSGDNDTTAQLVYGAVASLSMQDRLSQAGVTEQEFTAAATPPAFSLQATDGGDSNDDSATGARYAVGFAFTILMYMAIMLYGTWIAQGVVEEKASRIMEIMINAATPRDLLAGKVLGIGLGALTQLVPMLLVGGIAFASQPRLADALGVKNDTISGIDFGSISASAVGSFTIYFLLGFLLYASLYASIASLVSRQEEVNQAISPLMSITIVGYLGALFTISSPDSIFARVLSIFPLTAPFSMVSRIVVGHPPFWEIALSVVLLAAAAILGIMFAARVYRVGVLMYGQKPSWKAVFNAGTVRAVR